MLNPSGITAAVGARIKKPALTRSTALLLIDLQYFDAHRDFGLGARAAAVGRARRVAGYYRRLEQVALPGAERLLFACREAQLPVLHARIVNPASGPGGLSRRYRELGFSVPPGSIEAEFLPQVAPVAGEVVLDKTTSDVFISTALDTLLRNLAIEALIVAGVATSNCVASTVRTAADLGYRVVIAEDACAAWSDGEHRLALAQLNDNFATVKSVAAVAEELKRLVSGGAQHLLTARERT